MPPLALPITEYAGLSCRLGLIINFLRQGFILQAGLKLCLGEDGLDLLSLKSTGITDAHNHPFHTQGFVHGRMLLSQA